MDAAEIHFRKAISKKEGVKVFSSSPWVYNMIRDMLLTIIENTSLSDILKNEKPMWSSNA